MTTPDERTRALRYAGELVTLILGRDDVPEDIRRMALYVDRHYPSAEEIKRLARSCHASKDWIFPELAPEEEKEVDRQRLRELAEPYARGEISRGDVLFQTGANFGDLLTVLKNKGLKFPMEKQ